MKLFRDQIKECKENGVLVITLNPNMKEILLCTKYGKECNSNVCKHERE